MMSFLEIFIIQTTRIARLDSPDTTRTTHDWISQHQTHFVKGCPLAGSEERTARTDSADRQPTANSRTRAKGKAENKYLI